MGSLKGVGSLKVNFPPLVRRMKKKRTRRKLKILSEALGVGCRDDNLEEGGGRGGSVAYPPCESGYYRFVRGDR
jgi:hypothetical protein